MDTWKTRKTEKTEKTEKRPHPLKLSYGVVILPKGTRLYHTNIGKACSYKPVLFSTLHPSEWYMENAYVSIIELQRDISLLFMVKMIYKLRVISAFNDYLGIPNSNLIKQNYNKIKEDHLEKEQLDGWFSSIENKTTVEFAIINTPSVLKIIDCVPIRFNWNNSSYANDMTLIPKKWGTEYPISSVEIPIKCILNSRFKPMIEEYQKQISEEDPRGTAFSILLENADISYFDAPLEKIQW